LLEKNISLDILVQNLTKRHVALNEKFPDDNTLKFIKELHHYEWPELMGRIETLSELANSVGVDDSFEDTIFKEKHNQQKF